MKAGILWSFTIGNILALTSFSFSVLEVDYFSKPTEVEEDLGSNSLEALVPVDFALNLTKW